MDRPHRIGLHGDKTTGSTQTLTFTEPGGNTGTFAPIGAAPSQSQAAPKPGSGFAFSSPLQDSSKNTVGELNATCIVTQGTGSFSKSKGRCTGTFDVPDGQLVVNVGGTFAGQTTSGSIIGGNGKYDGATGTFQSVQQAHDASEDTFTITLP